MKNLLAVLVLCIVAICSCATGGSYMGYVQTKDKRKFEFTNAKVTMNDTAVTVTERDTKNIIKHQDVKKVSMETTSK